MPELPSKSLLSRLRRIALLSAGALALHALPACTLAQTVPATLRACTAQTDPTRRLACYDREMARLSTPPAPAPPPAAATPAPPVAATPAPAPVAATPAPAPVAATPAAPAPRSPSARHWVAPWKIFSGGASSAVRAHVVSLQRWPDSMVLHLDNGQTWQQIGRASGDLSLRPGDEVTIEKHLGSYWLSSRYVSSMQVRLKP